MSNGVVFITLRPDAAPVVSAVINTGPNIRCIPMLPANPAPAPKPAHARPAGKVWSVTEVDLVLFNFRRAGYAAAYNAVPHRSKPAVRGYLQRAGLVPKR